ncbi:MAG: LysM peptidoglycan-binding domain-containing M23 family metallopeptidase [Nisaea sp.]|uniref:LysM peptidoglycan-binding domain-containing M23 family metallopeptidase n=1 Tax=Nisaea sp. TaxID=2024842 RepID=UPI0032635C36
MAMTFPRIRNWLALLVLASLLAACGAGAPRLAYSPSGKASSHLAIPSGGRISAGPRDTVYEISRRYGVPVRDIILANQLQPPYKLYVGQDLRLPAPSSYVVRQGDTVFSISRRFNVDMRTVVQMNDITPPYQIRVGQEMRLPSQEIAKDATVASNTRTSLSAPQLPKGPGSRGSTTRTALLSPGTVALPRLNPRNAAPSAGQTVVLRPPVVKPRAAPVPATKAKTGLEVAKIRPPKRAGSKFRWPVRGRIIANFGPRKGGLHNDGINIAAPRGAAVTAADNGVVAYAGDGLPGFGKLLLLKHANGWITAYAHCDRLLVKRGEIVQRGQTIATVGSSGSVDQPQLHFEVRREKRAVDPRQYLDSI